MQKTRFTITPKAVALAYSALIFALSTTLFGLNCAVVANSAQRDGSGNGPLSIWNVISMLILSLICIFGCLAYQKSKASFIVLYHKAFLTHWVFDAIITSSLIIASTVPLNGAGYSKVTIIVIIIFTAYKLALLGTAFLVWRYLRRSNNAKRVTSGDDDLEAAKSSKSMSIPLKRTTSSAHNTDSMADVALGSPTPRPHNRPYFDDPRPRSDSPSRETVDTAGSNSSGGTTDSAVSETALLSKK
jgi:hypothetical protein